MKASKLVLLIVVLLIILFGCKNKSVNEINSYTEKTSNVDKNSQQDDVENNTKMEVGEASFSINIPKFNVMPEGDIVDKNGNTWLILQSDEYDNLLIQLVLHNKQSKKLPQAYSNEDFGLIITNENQVNYHNFKKETIQETESLHAQIYIFETDSIEGQILFLADSELSV